MPDGARLGKAASRAEPPIGADRRASRARAAPAVLPRGSSSR